MHDVVVLANNVGRGLRLHGASHGQTCEDHLSVWERCEFPLAAHVSLNPQGRCIQNVVGSKDLGEVGVTGTRKSPI